MNASAPHSQDLLPADLSMGTVMLKVADMNLMSDYYQRALGLEVLAEQDGGLHLGRGANTLVHLAPAAGLRIPGRGEAGLFHTALLFPDRAKLAATVATAASYDATLYQGSADHLVSQAFYFGDPEGNGIELYYDRPRSEWDWNTDGVVMDSLPLDPNGFLSEHLDDAALRGQRQDPADVGHVHLQVGDVPTAHHFYVETLGFERTAVIGHSALFVSAGGYHHHMAMNVWNSRGAGPRKDTLGLGEVLLRVPSADDVAALADRLRVAGISHHHAGAELRFEDPWRNRLRVAVG